MIESIDTFSALPINYEWYFSDKTTIVENDLDGSYVISEEEIEESDKVKKFEKFFDDLKKILIE